jgi:fructokinase
MTAASAPTPDGGVILVGGEALYDVVLSDDGEELTAHPGGGPFNAARAIARLERPVAYLGRLSDDRFGARLERILVDDGVRLESVVRTEDPTTLALAELGDGGSVSRYRFYAQGTSAAGLTSEAALAALPEKVHTVFVGTLGLVLEPMASALEAVVDRLSATALVAVDPNCRPDVIRDPAAYRRRLGWILARSHLLKVSEEDVGWLYPDRDPVDATRALMAGGPAIAVLTRGGDGAVVVSADRAEPVAAPAIEVVDTIGAGDAFAGGFLSWWHEKGLGREALADVDTAVEATRFACIVAARTCERAGASPPRRSDL